MVILADREQIEESYDPYQVDEDHHRLKIQPSCFNHSLSLWHLKYGKYQILRESKYESSTNTQTNHLLFSATFPSPPKLIPANKAFKEH